MLADAWIVGSTALPDADLSNVRDWDLLIPFDKWPIAAGLIPETATPNTFGGWKINWHGIIIDVWPGDLSQFLRESTTKGVWHLGSGKRFIKV